jgi:hypothetical protein
LFEIDKPDPSQYNLSHITRFKRGTAGFALIYGKNPVDNMLKQLVKELG